MTNALFVDKKFKADGCVIDIAVFNGDVLLAGHLPSQELLDEVQYRLSPIKGYKRLFNKITVQNASSNSVEDGWITTKIRSQIFADGSINPNAFKVITSDNIVYLMGEVKKNQAEKVIELSRHTTGVEQVVTILKYYTYQSRKVWPDKNQAIQFIVQSRKWLTWEDSIYCINGFDLYPVVLRIFLNLNSLINLLKY